MCSLKAIVKCTLINISQFGIVRYITDYGTYDFVIIGAGSAGAVVANRLSEICSWKILLLEAGKPGNDFTDIPAMYRHLPSSEYNWGYFTTPQANCCLAFNGTCPYPRGKALGGSSTINTMMYSRGNKLDYDEWGSAGNEGWYFKDVLPYFKKSERSTIHGDKFYHSTIGYLNVEHPKSVSKLVPAFLKGHVEMGTPIGDYNGKNQLVTEPLQLTAFHGRRMSVEKAFLYPAKNRRNLDILTESYVTRIVFEKFSRTATGVIFSNKNIKYIVNVTKEVILSAGVFGSPQILILSGVGPTEQLNKHRIDVVKHLEVGKTLIDHTYIQLNFNSSIAETQTEFRTAIKQYLSGFGPLTSNADAVSLYDLRSNDSTVADLEIFAFPLIPLGITDNEVSKTDNKHGTFSILALLLHTNSVGKVYLKSSDPYAFPIIDSNCFSDPNNKDIAELLKAIQLVLKLLEQNAFKDFKPVLIPDDSCIQHGIMSENYWRCYLRRNAAPGLHGVGTCRMGPNTNDGSVVDNKLRVHGIRNLRIADTSIIPVSLSAHTSVPAIMVGERAADFIKEEYQSF